MRPDSALLRPDRIDLGLQPRGSENQVLLFALQLRVLGLQAGQLLQQRLLADERFVRQRVLSLVQETVRGSGQ